MALSLDDKLLGEKVHYYCSSSEGENEEDDDEREDYDEGYDGKPAKSSGSGGGAIKDSNGGWTTSEMQAESNGIVTNTGPKGVIKDWREFKRMETEKRQEQEREKQGLAKKLTLTCRSHLNDEDEKKEDEEFLVEMGELEDEFFKEYRLQRIEEMRKALADIPTWGKVISLDASNFLKEVDEVAYGVTVIVHIYEQNVPACVAMNGCLSCLASEYPTVKFCKLSASGAQMSLKFASKGVPALLVYKDKELLGNFVRLREEFGDDFFATDVESFLQEHSYLPSKESMYVIRDATTGELRGKLNGDDDDSGSDFDVD